MSVLGYYVVKTYIVGETQKQVDQDLKTIRSVYGKQLEKMEAVFALTRQDSSLEEVKKTLGLDYLYRVTPDEAPKAKSEIVREAFTSRKSVGGKRILEKDELLEMGKEFYEKARIEIQPTPKAHPHTGVVLEKAMGLECARPFTDPSGNVNEVLYGGKIVNRNFQLIDEISDTVFENKLYEGKPVGTVTIFLDDTRIATNVLNDKGERAIGTIVSDSVYRKVVEKGEKWLDRAFVVTDWYLTAYEPIRGIRGDILGIRYVGILEKPFVHMQRDLFVAFSTIIICIASIALAVAFLLAKFLTGSFLGVLHAAQRMSEGHLESRAKVHTVIREVRQLTESFNQMADKLAERERSLAVSNEKLKDLNQTYLDMIGFVSHELKGILYTSSINVYTLGQEMVGALNAKQKEIVAALGRGLDYLSAMVRNFLSLSRIEKGELEVVKTELLLKENIFDEVIETFEKPATEKKIQILNKLPAQTRVRADDDLIKIVGNNLITNAIKYGLEGGTVIVSARDKDRILEVEIYNDGAPIKPEDAEKLFKRFSRLPGEAQKQKGTGLGLFITKEILSAHGGEIRLETKPFGNSFIFTIEKGG